jgi:hypothetical protein
MLKKFLPLYVAQSPIATHKLRDLKPAPAADKANCMQIIFGYTCKCT